MATGKVVVNVLDVGQGQGTFVEVYDTGGNLTNTLLFDLGSAKSKEAAGGASIKYIVGKIKTMTNPKIDYLSLSHKDRDHVNLVIDLLDELKKVSSSFKVGGIRYGGAKDWYSKDLITKLGGYCSDVQSLNLRHVCYDPKKKAWVPIWNLNDVFVYIIVANIPTDSTFTDWSQVNLVDKPDSELANSVSIVASIWWKKYQFFINGDATFVTMEESNKIYDFQAQWANPQMVTLPHHGSRKTTFGLNKSTDTPSADSLKVVTEYAKKISAKTVTASADTYGTYHHPSFYVMDFFLKFADSNTWCHDPRLTGNSHFITAYTDIPLKNSAGVTIAANYTSFQTTMNIYSTLYCAPAFLLAILVPPYNPVSGGTTWTPASSRPAFEVGVQWGYIMDSSGIKLTLTTSRAGKKTFDAIIEPMTEPVYLRAKSPSPFPREIPKLKKIRSVH